MKPEMDRVVRWAAVLAVLLLAVSCSGKKTRVILLPEKDNPHAAVAIGEGDQATVLDAPMTAAEVGSRGRVDTQPVSLPEVEKDFARALAAEPPEPISYILYFEEGSTEVLKQSRATLQALFKEVARRQAVEVQVTGHTDTVGSEADNDLLSQKRAEAIRSMLIEKGLRASFIRAVGRGEREPLTPTPDNTREPKNRRVEVIVR